MVFHGNNVLATEREKESYTHACLAQGQLKLKPITPIVDELPTDCDEL